MLSIFTINIILNFYVLKITNKLNPLYVWIALQIVMYSGTFWITNENNNLELNHFYLYSLFVFIANITAIFYCINKKRDFYFRISDRDILYLKKIFYISTIMIIFYFYLVGENLFISSIKNMIINGEVLLDVKDRRFSFYSGERYVAPGFFNLFKNFLLPASFFSLIILDNAKRINLSKSRKIIYWSIFLILILGTGQRGAFIMSFVYAFAISRLLFNKEKIRKLFIRLSILGMVFLIISTFFLSRGTGTTLSDLSDISIIGESIIDRFLFVNQYSGLDTFKYITESGESTQWGYDWLMMLEQLLPGRSTYIPLDNKSFNYVYGSFLGTNPPSLMVSCYYNFGIMGVILTPFFFVVLCNTIFKYYLKHSNNYNDYLIYVLIYFAMSTWVNSGIDYPLRNGLILIPIFLFLKKIKFKQ